MAWTAGRSFDAGSILQGISLSFLSDFNPPSSFIVQIIEKLQSLFAFLVILALFRDYS